MITVQRKSADNWKDYAHTVDIEDAEGVIREAIEKGLAPEEFRVVDILEECRTEVVFEKLDGDKVNTMQELAEEAEEEKKSEEDMLADFLRKMLELGGIPKVEEIDNDENMPNYGTYYATFGSKGNVADMVLADVQKEEITPKYQEVLRKHCNICQEMNDIPNCQKDPVECLLERLKEEE